MPLVRPRPRGTSEQHGRRPFGARSRLLLYFKNLAVQVGRFGRSSRTLARRSSCLHGRAVGTAGSILSLKCRLVTYRLPVAKGRQVLSPVAKFRGAKPGRSGAQGTKGKKHQSRQGSLGRRFATRPAVPMPKSYHSWGAETITPCAPAPDRRRGPGRRGILYTVPVSPPSFAPTRRSSRPHTVPNQRDNGRIEVCPGIVGKGHARVLDPIREHVADPLL